MEMLKYLVLRFRALRLRCAAAYQALPTWIHRPLAYTFDKYWNYAVGALVGSTAVYLWTLFFPPAVDVYFVQSALGEHCPVQLFDEAVKRGIALVFEPPSLRSIAVCGPGNHERQVY